MDAEYDARSFFRSPWIFSTIAASTVGVAYTKTVTASGGTGTLTLSLNGSYDPGSTGLAAPTITGSRCDSTASTR